jgi:glyoxylase-like metal-dependent hydrolase (beta-lactamase superfamily II)
MTPFIESFFDEGTSSFTYLVADLVGRRAAIIDPVLDFDIRSARITTTSADRVLARLREHDCTLDWILETHAHADHLSASAYLQRCAGGRIATSENIRRVQAVFAPIFGLSDMSADGSPFDQLWADGETFSIGALQASVLETPGHTSDSVSYLMGDCAFVGDSLFMPDCGTARCDFPGGDAGVLYDSVQRLYSLPEAMRLFVGHDYPPEGRGIQNCAAVRTQKHSNVHIQADTGREDFVAIRRSRDATLEPPSLLMPAMQVNIRAGRLPSPEANGRVYLKLPVNALMRAAGQDLCCGM